MKKQRKKRSVKHTFLRVICGVLAVILVILLAAVVLVKDLLSGIGRVEESSPTLSSEEVESILKATDPVDENNKIPTVNAEEVPVPTSPVESVVTGKNVTNFLLVGQDRREGYPRMHSDAMILVTVNKEKKTVTMTSFMRDLWVQIPGYYKERLNVPYMIDPTNGFNLLNETLEYNFGVSAEHNAEVDFSGFKAAIDAAGGITIELTAAEANHLNKNNSSWSLTEGENHLNGEQALAYSRIRKIGNDFARTGRQRTVLTALIEKAKTLSLTQLYSLVKEITPMITTDMTDAQILGYVVEYAPMLSDFTIVSQRIPADGAYYDANINGNLVLALSERNLETNLQILRDSLGE